MNAKLTFKLPEEESEFRHAANGSHYAATLFKVDQEIRSILKYGIDDGKEGLEKKIEQLRTTIREELEGTNWED